MTTNSSTTMGCSFFHESPTSIFTPEHFSGDELLMIKTAEDFSRKEVLPLVERLEKQEDGLMQSLILKAGELGLCSVDAPEEYGGLGMGTNLCARIIEFMSLDGSFSVTYGVTTGIAILGLKLFGTTEQKEKYLPKLCSGEWIGAYCLSEPNSGSDALSLSTRADLDGDNYVLNGTKMWISNAKWANFFLVMAKVDGDKTTAFLVERDTPGLSIAREEHKLGLKGSSTARVVLENARVPKENLLHQIGQGHKVALNSLNIGRFKLAAMSLGPARQAMNVAVQYAQDRKQFGTSISEFGLIEQKFATMAALYYGAESIIYRTGDCIDSAFAALGGTVEGNQKAAEEFSIEFSACKVFTTEAEAYIVDEAVQVYGGYGFTEEFPVARIFRDARVSRIYEGTNEINRIFLSDRLVKRIYEGRIPMQAREDSFISGLVAKAMPDYSNDQLIAGAISDLLIYNFVEQSARLRAEANGGVHLLAYNHLLNILNVRAAAAYQQVSGKAVTVPAPAEVDISELAKAVYKAGGPL